MSQHHDVGPLEADLHQHAYDEIVARGWCQHVVQDSEGRVCLLGALNYADNKINLHHLGLWLDASSRLDAMTGGNYIAWNNAPGRTIDEVLDLLTKAAHNAREGL